MAACTLIGVVLLCSSAARLSDLQDFRHDEVIMVLQWGAEECPLSGEDVMATWPSLISVHAKSCCFPCTPFIADLRVDPRAKNLFSCPCVLRKTTPLFSILKDVAIGISFLSSVSSVVYLVLWEVRMRRRQRRQDVRTTKDHLIEQVPRLQLDEENVDEPLNEGGVADDTDQLVSTESE